jgi:hypothetical protein
MSNLGDSTADMSNSRAGMLWSFDVGEYWRSAKYDPALCAAMSRKIGLTCADFDCYNVPIQRFAGNFPLGDDQRWEGIYNTPSRVVEPQIHRLNHLLHDLYAAIASEFSVKLATDGVLFFLKLLAEKELSVFEDVNNIQVALNAVAECDLFTPADAKRLQSDMAAVIGLRGKEEFLPGAYDFSICYALRDAVRYFIAPSAVSVTAAVLPRRRAVDILEYVMSMLFGERHGVEAFLRALLEHCRPALASLHTLKLAAIVQTGGLRFNMIADADQPNTVERVTTEHHVQRRLMTVDLMDRLWRTYRGKRDKKSPSETESTFQQLSLRRFCRTRGKNASGMPFEIVEPFARDIVRFL